MVKLMCFAYQLGKSDSKMNKTSVKQPVNISKVACGKPHEVNTEMTTNNCIILHIIYHAFGSFKSMQSKSWQYNS